MRRIARYFIGTKKYKVTAGNPSFLCGRLMSEFPEAVFDVKVTANDTFEFSTYLPESVKVINYLSSFECELTLFHSAGFISYLCKKTKSPGIILGLTLAIISVIFQNSAVWDITVSGNKTVGDEEIISTLERAGFAVGKRYNKSEIPSVCNRFVLLDDRFSHISVNMSGNAAFVEVTERRKKEETPTYISDVGFVADKDCIIVRSEVFNGTSLVKEGDTVSKGTVIVTPYESGTAKTQYFTGASGKVYAKTYEDFAVVVPYITNGMELSGKEKIKSKYEFLGMNFDIINPLSKDEASYFCENNSKKITVSEDIYLPVKVNKVKKLYYNPRRIIYEKGEAEEKAYEIMYRKLSHSLKECEILSTSYSNEVYDDKYILRCRAECIKNVAVYPE